MITLDQVANLQLPPATKKFMKSVDRIEIFDMNNKTTMNIFVDRSEKDILVLCAIIDVLYQAVFSQLDEQIKINAYDSKNELIAELK